MENENSQQTPGGSSETKQAETRLKEMSRKAKQKGKDKTSSKTKSVPPLFNQNWFCIGIGLANIAGITYLIFTAGLGATSLPQSKEVKQHQRPNPPNKKLVEEKDRFLDPTPRKQEKAPAFELNSF